MLGWLLDVLAPPRCTGCGGIAAALCDRCITTIADQPPIVRRNVAGVRLIVGLGSYDGVLRRAILSLKYTNAAAIGEALGRLLARHAHSVSALVPVPLHASRLRKRGYNQAEALARGVCRAMQEAGRAAPPLLTDALIRARATAPQSGLDHDARADNVGAAFRPGPGANRIRNCHVVLIDDVLTTGATLRACATELRRSGAACIDALCAAIKP